MVEGVKHFCVYLLGAEFTVVTDHNSLVYLEKMKDENGRLARWDMALMPYMYTIVHRPGSKNHYGLFLILKGCGPIDMLMTVPW